MIKEFQEYVRQKEELQEILLQFIDEEPKGKISFQDMINFFKSNQVIATKEKFKELLHLLSKISKNHHRTSEFNSKIEQILKYFSNEIEQTLSNSEIFDMFKGNKIIILFLIEERILKLDKLLVIQFLNKCDSNMAKYYHFFKEEIELVLKQENINDYGDLFQFDQETLENFNEKRLKGENDSPLTSLIRENLIDEFIVYVKKQGLPISNVKINPSIFETNSFLLKRKPTLIEYSAFYGSLEIFKFLYKNSRRIAPSIWIYAIHSNKLDIIHFLENEKFYFNIEVCKRCVLESIKCHHNEIAEYFIHKYLTKQSDEFTEKCTAYSFRYHNYKYFPKDLSSNLIFYLSCQYDYLSVLKLLLETRKIDVNEKIFDVHFIKFQGVSYLIFF